MLEIPIITSSSDHHFQTALEFAAADGKLMIEIRCEGRFRFGRSRPRLDRQRLFHLQTVGIPYASL